MTMSQRAPLKRYFLLFVAIVLLLAGGAGLYLGSHDFEVRSLALIAILASTYVVRMSRGRYTHPSVAEDQATDFQVVRWPGRRLWTVGIAFLLLAAVSYLYLYNDALHGYHEVLPVYVFAGVGLACVMVWAYLVSRIVR